MFAVDELARLQVAVRHLGYSIRLRDAGGGLSDLLDLAGLAEVVKSATELIVEVGRKPEGGEKVGVEESVEPGDPAA
jgi:hypothetical protein